MNDQTAAASPRNAARITIHEIGRNDIPRVAEIERASFPYPWEERDFVEALKQPRCYGIAAFIDDQLVGYAIIEFEKRNLHIRNLAVEHGFRRKRVAEQMVQSLIARGAHRKLKQIHATVRETNLTAQLFLRCQDFRWIETVKNRRCPDVDDYHFVYEIG
jgi:ribosomal-protein-alanine N-acetyltransferase